MKFFNIATISKPINCTFVNLIPKVKHLASIKEYKPISYCNVIYKIISKIIISRLGEVISGLTDGSQAAFVPGRLMSDNIILSHELIKCHNIKGISPRCMLKVDLQKAYDSLE